MDFYFKCINELLNFEWDFVFSEKFLGYGIIIFWFVFPIIIYFFVQIVIFLIDYREFRLWKSEQEENLKD